MFGRTANIGGIAGVRVPAKYDGFDGLPAKASDATSVPGADTDGMITLDVDISKPTLPAPPGGYPLVVMMHGCCAGDKFAWQAGDFGTGERWHYNNAWFAARGYVVANFTSRGFRNQAGGGGSTGETQLDSRLYEINDFQYLAGLIADEPSFNVDPQKVIPTGGSYGGGFSWLALTDPKWRSPGGKSMKLVATAPRYGWTDIVDSLIPNGHQSQYADDLPAFDGSDSTEPFGIPKQSIDNLLYGTGQFGATFTSDVDQSFVCLGSPEPFETAPGCQVPIATILPTFITDRSAYYQNQWFARIGRDTLPWFNWFHHQSKSDYRIPIFNAGTLTDPLFPPIESLRMVNRIQRQIPKYPIKQYYGDYQHFVQNKAKEWGDLCGADHHVCAFADYPGGDVNAAPTGLYRTGVTSRLNDFIDYFAKPPGNTSRAQAGERRDRGAADLPAERVGRLPGGRAGADLHGGHVPPACAVSPALRVDGHADDHQ